MPTSALDLQSALNLAQSSLRDVLSSRGVTVPELLGPDTLLLGKGAVVDSIGLVTVIMEFEQRLSDAGVSVTLVSEKAMSASRSPFRTIGSLAQFACDLAAEAR